MNIRKNCQRKEVGSMITFKTTLGISCSMTVRARDGREIK